MGADTHLGYAVDDNGWYLVDKSASIEYRSPMDSGKPVDYAYVGRLSRPDGKGTFLYLAGTHAPGTLAAAHFVVDNLQMEPPAQWSYSGSTTGPAPSRLPGPANADRERCIAGGSGMRAYGGLGPVAFRGCRRGHRGGRTGRG